MPRIILPCPRLLRPGPVLASLALLAACGGDPLDRPGTVRTNGSNEANLRAMIVDPSQLQQGIGTSDARGAVASNAVDRLLSGEPYKLSDPRKPASGP